MNKAQCTACSYVMEYEGGNTGLNACPKCGHKGIPFDPTKNITVEINLHELRILCMWAERWAGIQKEYEQASMGAALGGIGNRLKAQPALKNANLFFFDDFREAKRQFPTMETNAIEVIPEEPKP